MRRFSKDRSQCWEANYRGGAGGGAEQAAVLHPLLDVQDLKGGLLAWSRMHPDFPIY